MQGARGWEAAVRGAVSKLSEALPCGVEGPGGDPAGGLPVRGEGAPGWGAGRAGRDARSKCNDFSVRLAKQGQS